jgi:hypothetical protein
MCGSGFVVDPRVPEPSCDEFPFAKSRESGHRLGLSWTQCSQMRPEFVDGKWTIYLGAGYDPAQRCGLGHVQNSHNGLTGLEYARFVQAERVLDNDPFFVAVVN